MTVQIGRAVITDPGILKKRRGEGSDEMGMILNLLKEMFRF